MQQNKGVAWYDSKGSGWLRDLWVLNHLPYTIWMLAYVIIGATLAPTLIWSLLGWSVLAFTFGITGGHALDELNGRPLRTTLSSDALFFIAIITISLGTWIGVEV